MEVTGPTGLALYTVPRSVMTETQHEHVIRLCSEVFRLDYRFYMDLPLERTHVLGYLGERLVAHALWLNRPLRIGPGPWLASAYVEGVATDAAFRGRGFGSAVMRRLQKEIDGYDLGALGADVPDWYARLGWARWRGPLFIEKDGALQATPDECVMVYPTTRSGQIDLDAPLTGEWRPFELW